MKKTLKQKKLSEKSQTIENKENNKSFIPVSVTGVQSATMDGGLEHA